MDGNNVLTGDVSVLKEFRAVVEKNDTARNMIDNIIIEEKRLQKEINLNEKNLKDNIEDTVKKRRSEVALQFDDEMAKGENRLRKMKEKRQRAKEKGVNERIADETSDLVMQNKELKGNIRSELKGERLSGFCGTGFYFAMFLTKGAKEVFVFILTVILTCLVMPGGVYLLLPFKNQKGLIPSIALVGTYFVLIALWVFIYWVIHHNTKKKHEEGLKAIRQLRERIAGNKKQISKISKSIRKDKNEEMYGLEDYDSKIKEIENEIKAISESKEKALLNFDSNIQPSITAEIDAKERPRIEDLNNKLQENISQRETLETVVKETNITISTDYEAYIGKNYSTVEKIDELIAVMENGQASTVSQAIDIVK